MCDAPGCSGARRGDVFVGGQHCGSACSPQCSERIGAQHALIGAPPGRASEMRTTLADLVGRVRALEQSLLMEPAPINASPSGMDEMKVTIWGIDDRVGAIAKRLKVPLASVSPPLAGLSEMKVAISDLADQVGMLEQAVSARYDSANVPPPAAAANPPPAAAAAEPLPAVPSSTIGVVFDQKLRNFGSVVAEIQRLVPDRAVAELSIDRLVPGQRVVLAIYAVTPRAPMMKLVGKIANDIHAATGRKPLLLVGVVQKHILEEWGTEHEIWFNEGIDGKIGFTFTHGGTFVRWRDGEPSSQRIGARYAPIGVPLTPAEMEASIKSLTDRVAALERAVIIRPPASSAPAAVATPPLMPASSLPVAVVPIGRRGVPDLVDEIQRLLPGNTVAETPVDRLVRGQRAIVVVYASTCRSPTGTEALRYVSDATAATGRLPLVLVGVPGYMKVLEEWMGFERASRDLFDGIVRFTFAFRGAFEKWRDGPPTAAQLLGQR